MLDAAEPARRGPGAASPATAFCWPCNDIARSGLPVLQGPHRLNATLHRINAFPILAPVQNWRLHSKKIMRHICATDAPEVRHHGRNFSAVLAEHLDHCLTLRLIVYGIGGSKSNREAGSGR
jgi:hypothetical protein